MATLVARSDVSDDRPAKLTLSCACPNPSNFVLPLTGCVLKITAAAPSETGEKSRSLSGSLISWLFVTCSSDISL